MNTSTLIDAFGVRRKSSLPPIKYQEVLKFNDVIRNVSSSKFNASSIIFSAPASHLKASLY
jgi:hypothetical protein